MKICSDVSCNSSSKIYQINIEIQNVLSVQLTRLQVISAFPASISLFKVYNENTRRCWRRSGTFIVNFEQTSHNGSGVSIIDSIQLNAG